MFKELESFVNDPDNCGCKVQINKLIDAGNEEQTKGKAAAKKGAPAPGEESKPVSGEAWLDLIPFKYAGCTESTQRIFIKTTNDTINEQPGDDKSQPPEKSADGTSQNAATTPLEEQKQFESRHCYVHLKITLSDPINPVIDAKVLPQSEEIAKKAESNMPPQFPSVMDAIKDYQNSVHAVVQEITIEYSRMFQNEEDASLAGATTVKSQNSNPYYISPQQREIYEQRRERFLIEFNSSQRYLQLRQKLKKAIFRLAVEKYNKQVDHKGLQTKPQKEQFKAELYTFLQEQMKIFLEQAISSTVESNVNMHADLVMTHNANEDDFKKRIQRNFREEEGQKFKRLSEEYDLIRDYEHSEWYILDLNEVEITDLLFNVNYVSESDKADPEKWF